MDNKTTIQPPDMEHNQKNAGQGDTPEDMAIFINKPERVVSDRKTVESDKHNKMKFEKALIESMPVPVYYKNIQGYYIAANKLFLDFFGISEQEIVGKTAFDITTKSLAEIFTAKDKELFQNPGHQTFEISMLDYKNVTHDVIFHESTFSDANGEVAGIIGVIQDISERKKIEAALKSATEELELFFSSALDLLCIADTDGYFHRLNREWEKVLGYSIEELEGQRFLDLVHPNDLQPTQDAMSNLASNREVLNFVNRYRCKDETYRWIEWRSIPVGNKIYAAARDITERIKTENTLRESEERYRNFIANASEGIFRIDFSQPIMVDQPYDELANQISECAYIAEVNTALSAMYGIKPEQMIGLPVRDFAPNCGIQIADLTKTDDFRLVDREESEFDANGNPIYIIESYHGVVENGILKRVWGVQRNITERKRVEKLISLQHDLAKSLSAVSGLNEGLQLCLETAIKSSEMDCGGIYLYDDISDELNLLVHQGLSPEFINIASIFKSNTPNMQLVLAGSPIYSQHPMLGFPHDDPRKNEALSSIAIVPINYQNRVIGCMNIASHSYRQVPKFSRDILEAIAAQMGNVISRLRSEEALRESEHRFRSIFDHAQDGILVADSKNQQILFGNKKISEMLGYTQEELKNFHISDIHPKDALPRVKEHFSKTLKGEAPVYEIPTLRKDGSTFCAEIIAFEITLQGISCLAGTFRDITERKQAVETLRRNEEMLRSILEATPAGVGLLINRVFIKTNKALSMITGYSEEELLGSSTHILYPDDEEYDRIGKEIYEQVEKTGLGIGEAHLQHKNGALIDVILCLSPFDPNDTSKGITATVLDITERKQVENALRENEALISSLFASVPVGLALIKDRIIIKVNETLCKMFDYSEQELLGSSSRMLYVSEEEYIRTGENIYAQIEQNGIGIGESRLHSKNGDVKDVLLCLSPLDISDVSKGITVTILDITDRKQAEAALRESEKKYRSVIENIQDVFYRADFNGRLLMGSPSGAKMFGYASVDEMIGTPLSTLWVDPTNRQKMISMISETNYVKDFEAHLKRKDGSTFYASFTTHFFYDDNGNRLGTEGIIRDITEQKKTQKEIRQLNEDLEARVKERTSQLETAIQELEAFSYSVSHDLRAPLRAINGYANILKEDYSPILGEEGNRICTIIGKETRRMSRLIDDLLSFARIGRVELQPYTIDMQAMVNSAFLELVTPEEQSRISFKVAPLEVGVGDSNLLRQVWINLISNAIKFSSKKDQAVIQINSECKENEVIYSIKDNGAGFDTRYAQSLFGVFTRLHNEKEFEGTGVGLAIVQRIITRHGGQVWAESEVNQGATFYFSLPKGSH